MNTPFVLLSCGAIALAVLTYLALRSEPEITLVEARIRMRELQARNDI